MVVKSTAPLNAIKYPAASQRNTHQTQTVLNHDPERIPSRLQRINTIKHEINIWT
jgi:hypothetical protein